MLYEDMTGGIPPHHLLRLLADFSNRHLYTKEERLIISSLRLLIVACITDQRSRPADDE